MSLVQLMDLPVLSDHRGGLVALEGEKSVPFSIQRVYYLFATEVGVARGFHAHKNLKQVAICVAGRCRFVLDNGLQRESVWLDSPTKGLLIDGFVWREMHDFSDDCVLLVLANSQYDESDYIRDYNAFIRQVRQ